jgi:hypothetical protein
MVIIIDISRALGRDFYSLSNKIYNIEVVVKVDKSTRKRPQRKREDSRKKNDLSLKKSALKVHQETHRLNRHRQLNQ